MVKTPDEIALMRISGKLLASVFDMLDKQDLAGQSTMQVNDLVERFITDDLKARPASKGQYGFQYVLNCSINDVENQTADFLRNQQLSPSRTFAHQQHFSGPPLRSISATFTLDS